MSGVAVADVVADAGENKIVAGVLAQLNDAFAGVLNGVSASVVQVRDQSRGAGAGTIWRSDGLIVTNAHVAHKGPFQVALYDGRVLDARLVARDEQHDLAALVVDADDLPAIEPGNSAELHSGQWVMALGHPWGIANAATSGVLINVGRHAEFPTESNHWVVADLHLRPGNSGGPLVDAQGRLIGVNTLMTGPGVGVAVSVETVKNFLAQVAGGKYGAAEAEAAPLAADPSAEPETPQFV